MRTASAPLVEPGALDYRWRFRLGVWHSHGEIAVTVGGVGRQMDVGTGLGSAKVTLLLPGAITSTAHTLPRLHPPLPTLLHRCFFGSHFMRTPHGGFGAGLHVIATPQPPSGRKCF